MGYLFPYAGAETPEERGLYLSGSKKKELKLSKRQIEVLRLADMGLTTTEIGARLGILRSTAGKHLLYARKISALEEELKRVGE